MLSVVLFYVFAVLIIASAIAVVTLRNIFHSALALVVTLFGVACLFVMLGAEFVAAVQILIYAGAVVVLMIFAIMLTASLMKPRERQSNKQVIPSLALGVILLGFLISLLRKTWGESGWVFNQLKPLSDGTAHIGESLLTTYLLPFEIVSVVLLVALVGSIVVARR